MTVDINNSMTERVLHESEVGSENWYDKKIISAAIYRLKSDEEIENGSPDDATSEIVKTLDVMSMNEILGMEEVKRLSEEDLGYLKDELENEMLSEVTIDNEHVYVFIPVGCEDYEETQEWIKSGKLKVKG